MVTFFWHKVFLKTDIRCFDRRYSVVILLFSNILPSIWLLMWILVSWLAKLYTVSISFHKLQNWNFWQRSADLVTWHHERCYRLCNCCGNLKPGQLDLLQLLFLWSHHLPRIHQHCPALLLFEPLNVEEPK